MALAITNQSIFQFLNSASADSASMVNNGLMQFQDGSTAGTASIVNNGILEFRFGSTAGAATITTNAGADTRIQMSATGGTARFIMNGGFLDFSGHIGPVTIAGSLEGTGNVDLAAVRLIVGTNNLSTTYSGDIHGIATGTLEKVGTGTLTFSGNGLYTGDTVVTAGTLALTSASAIGATHIELNGGILRADATMTLGNSITVTPGRAGHIVAGDGRTLSLTGNLNVAGATAIQFGQAGGTGVIISQNVGVGAAPLTFDLNILGGTLRQESGEFFNLTATATATNIAAGATYELASAPPFGIRNLQSAGSVVINAGFTSVIAGGLSSAPSPAPAPWSLRHPATSSAAPAIWC